MNKELLIETIKKEMEVINTSLNYTDSTRKIALMMKERQLQRILNS